MRRLTNTTPLYVGAGVLSGLLVAQGLAPGTNHFTVLATDGSPYANQTSRSLAVVYLPVPVDGDGDGMPDAWESAHGLDPGVNDGASDADGDGFSNSEEYRAGTDPQSSASKPEGAGSVHYVLFRDHFDDAQYQDRWYLDLLDANADYALTESGTVLQGTVQRPALGCTQFRLQSFATVDAIAAVYHAKLRMEGYGATTLGLAKAADAQNNRIELRFEDTTPYLRIRSWNAGVLTETTAVTPINYRGATLDVQVSKSGSQYKVYVNGVYQGAATNAGIGNTGLRATLSEESCLANAGFVDSRYDLVELLLDRDGDGLADINEDKNKNGVVDTGESNPLSPDTDADSKPDGFDNCTLKANANQRDTNSDGYGNLCDPDLDNNGIVNAADQTLMQSRFYSKDPDADLNGDGFVNFADLAILKSLYGKTPGPSGVVP